MVEFVALVIVMRTIKRFFTVIIFDYYFLFLIVDFLGKILE